MLNQRPYLIAAIFWLIMVAIFFFPTIFQGKVIAPLDIMDSLLRPWATSEDIQVHNAFTYDAISQYLPYDYSVYQSLQEDGYIGWNPYTHSGTSIVENTMICPGDWHHHLYRFLPFWTAWNLGIILQFTIAGLGMLVFLRHQKIPAPYALIGVVAFGFYSQYILWINHRWVLGAMCWAPWIVWSLLSAKEKNRILHVPSIVFIALAFRGGHLQACLFVFLLVLFVSIGEWWKLPQKKKLGNLLKHFFPYAVSGFFAAILTCDVFIETIPPYIKGCKELSHRPWIDSIIGLPTILTSLIPTILGTPQGLDVNKYFHFGLFSIKFVGAVALLLAILAFFDRFANNTAKFLFIIGYALAFTPAEQWLYSRYTPIFALGAGWLAAWKVNILANSAAKKCWRKVWIVFYCCLLLWLLASIFVTSNQDWFMGEIQPILVDKLDANKASRIEWMISRAQTFLEETKIWHVRNVLNVALIWLGVYCVSKINACEKNKNKYAILLACCTFLEIYVFAQTWITFADKPKAGGLYDTPTWAMELKKEVGEGKVLVINRIDFDYMQLNTPSAYGIRFADGYETITPQRVTVPSNYDPILASELGISHILLSPKYDTETLKGWIKVTNSKQYVLYRNPLFGSLASGVLVNGKTETLTYDTLSPNRRRIAFSKDVREINIAESYNSGWKYSADGENWHKVTANRQNGIRIDLTKLDSFPDYLLLQYRPAYANFYHPILYFAIFGLIAIMVLQKKRIHIAKGN